MSVSDDVDFFVALERCVWQALKDGDAGADAALLADDFLGVYASGLAGKADHAGQLRDGPTVSWYELTAPQVIGLAEGVVALTYRARWQRAASCEPESMYVTSIWRRQHDEWVNVFSQDTKCEP